MGNNNQTDLEQGDDQLDSFNVELMLLQLISMKQKRKGSCGLWVIL